MTIFQTSEMLLECVHIGDLEAVTLYNSSGMRSEYCFLSGWGFVKALTTTKGS